MCELQDKAAWFNGGFARCATLPLSPKRKSRLVLLGASGAGKGTQAKLLCQQIGPATFQTGMCFARGLAKLSPQMEEVMCYVPRR